jgi:HK97 family phage major capsid protein
MATRATTRVQFGENRADRDPYRGFESVRDFLGAVMRAGRGHDADERLKPLQVSAAVGSDEDSGNEGQYGGFMIPIGFAPDTLSVFADNPTASLVTPVPMEQPQVHIGARTDKNHATSVSGGLILSRTRETTLPASSRMAVEQITLYANTLMGLDYSSGELAQDTPRAFIAILEAAFRDEYAAKSLVERLFGLGGAEPLGVMNSPCLITIAKETGQATGTIMTENIDKIAQRVWRYSSRAVWLANDDCLLQLQGLTRSVGVGGTTVNYLTYNDAGEARLNGRPIFFSEFCSALGTAGDLICGVWDQYLYGTYQPLQGLESVHTRFDTHDNTFKFFIRSDGAPWWRSVLTPRNSAITRSPFVTLASRP